MAEKDTTTVNVLGKPTSRKQQANRRIGILVVGIIILLLVIIAAYRPVTHFISWNRKTTAQQQTIINKIIFLDQIHNQPAQATKYLQSLQHYYTLNSVTRYFINMQLANFYVNNNNPAAALKIYQSLVKTHPNDYLVLLGLANSADHANDKSLAVQYYQKVVDWLNANKPAAYQSDIDGFQARIRVLEQGQ